MEPRIQYATASDGVTIAYTVAGEGPPIVYSTGAPFSHVQQAVRYENYRVYNEAVGRNRRLIMFDARGSGMSQRGVSSITLDTLTADIEAVVDKLGLETFAMLSTSASGLAAINYAAKHPDRLTHLVLLDAYPSGKRFSEIPQVRGFLGLMQTDWALFTESLAHFFFGWDAGEPAREYAAFLRDCVNVDDALRFFNAVLFMDTTPLLPHVKQPALVLQHSTVVLPDLDIAGALTAALPNAELIVLEGEWNKPGTDPEVIDRAITRLIGQTPTAAPAPVPTQHSHVGGLVTILFTDIEGSTALTQRLGDIRAREVFREHERLTREALARHGGSEVKTMGDGFMASFGSANGALECAVDMQRVFAAHNATGDVPVNVRIGINAGEPIAEQEDLFGTAVITAARIAGQAQGGEILVSNVVRELIAGRGFLFADRGEVALRGFDDPVRVYEMKWRQD